MSGAMQAYGPAVAWIAANGYRGIYTETGYLDDSDNAESQASVARLNNMFPGIGTIDKTIALMATKVAIWKVVGGDSVKVEKTTLDGTPARDTFDALVDGLVSEAQEALMPGVKPLISGEIRTTNLNIEIDPAINAFYDDNVGTAYNYYGPLTVTASLTNGPSGLPDLQKVFLTASGADSSGVMFVSQKTNNPSDELAKDRIFGTDRNAPYVGGNIAGAKWISDEFYVAIPKNRSPERGDRLQVKAYAMAPDVDVAEGTPVVLAYAENGVQDWTAIQAFVGGAAYGQRADLYAEASWNTGSTSLGELYISKQVEDVTTENMDQQFTFGVYYNDSKDFSTAKRLNMIDYPVLGAASVNKANSTFTLKNSGLALIKGLPMVVNGGDTSYEYYYWVEEVGLGPEYEIPHFVLNTGSPSGLQADGFRIGPFQLDEANTELGFVTVNNAKKPGSPGGGGKVSGELIISKRLEGSFTDWGVDESTVFYVKIKDTTKDNYLVFKAVPEADGSYWCVGNNVEGLSETYTGATTMELPVSVKEPLGVSNLWAGAVYVAEETGNPPCEVDYLGNGAIYSEGQVADITIVNTYDRGAGALIINKKLDGDYADWGVDSSTKFTVKIKDVTGAGNYLMFKTEPEKDGSYWCVGNDVDGLSEDYKGATTTQLTLTAGRPLMVSNLWTGLVYEVQETSGDGYKISYIGNGVAFAGDDKNSIVRVVNTYGPNVPNEPGEPGDPGTPLDPNEPPGSNIVPPTGDNFNPLAAVALILLGTGCIGGAEVYRRHVKKGKTDKM